MKERSLKITAVIGILIGGIFGMTGSFVSSPSLRSLAWGLDGIGLVVATSLFAVYYFRKCLDMTAGGFVIFAIGQSLVLSSSGFDLDANAFTFGSGTGLWAASLFVISLQKTYPLFIRITGLLAAVLFSMVAIHIFIGNHLNALTKPLPFYAYPVLVITIFGWAWSVLKEGSFTSTKQ